MAASDQTYRSQRSLDVVFGATCLLMLVSIIGMFIHDNLDYPVPIHGHRVRYPGMKVAPLVPPYNDDASWLTTTSLIR